MVLIVYVRLVWFGLHEWKILNKQLDLNNCHAGWTKSLLKMPPFRIVSPYLHFCNYKIMLFTWMKWRFLLSFFADFCIITKRYNLILKRLFYFLQLFFSKKHGIFEAIKFWLHLRKFKCICNYFHLLLAISIPGSEWIKWTSVND